MIRFVLQEILLFASPFLAYFLYRFLTGRGKSFIDDTPWFALSLTGVGLSVIAMIALGLVEHGDPRGRYVPPSYQDGKIVPGHVVPATEQ